MKSKNSVGVNVGGASVLVIFVVLCLAIFGMLSVVSANAELRLSRKTGDAIGQYYAADKKANDALEFIHEIITTNIENGITSADEMQAALSKIDQLTVVADTANAALTISFNTKINTEQYLAAQLSVPLNGQLYTIKQWKVQRNDTLVYSQQEVELFDPDKLLESME